MSGKSPLESIRSDDDVLSSNSKSNGPRNTLNKDSSPQTSSAAKIAELEEQIAKQNEKLAKQKEEIEFLRITAQELK